MRTKIAGLLAAAIGFGFAQAASAADMPTKAPIIKAPPPIVYSWTGFYGGLNAGVGFAAGSYTLSPQGCFLTGACGGSPAFNPLRTFSFNNSNTFFTGGGQLGYNWQTGTWVLGVETDFNYNGWNADSTNSIVLAAPLVGSFVNATNTKLDWFGTLRGRVGYLVNPALLIYGTGGLAYGHVSSSTSVAFTGGIADTYAGSGSATRAGWTVGGGLEWSFAPRWSAKVEYLYMDLGTLSYSVPCVSPAGAAFCTAFTPAPAYQTDVQFREHIARVGINYHFMP